MEDSVKKVLEKFAVEMKIIETRRNEKRFEELVALLLGSFLTRRIPKLYYDEMQKNRE